MKRLPFIDSIKGFAIICVVLGHVANGYIGEGFTHGIYHDVYNAVYAFHMPLFFMVSGFLFRRVYFSENGIRAERFRTQVINLICLYFIYCLLLGGSKMFFGRYVVNPVTVKDLLLIPVRPVQHFWYLYVLVIYYCIFSRAFVYRQSKALLLVLTFGLSVASHWIPAMVPCEIKRLLFNMFFFCLGTVLADTDSVRKPKYLCFLLLPVIFALYILFWNNEKNLNEILLVSSVLGTACSLFFWEVFRQYDLLGKNRILSFVGKYSLEIYLLHSFVLTPERTLFRRINISNDIVILLISTVTGVIIPILISVICRKIGIHRFLFSPYKKKTAE